MIMKSLLAAAAVATAAFAVSAPANAKVNIDLYFGGGGYGYVPSYDYYEPAYPVYNAPRRHRRGWDHEPRERYSGISCGEGRDKVDWSGFNRVRTVECSGPSYTYRALRHGKGYVVKVSRRHGDIISVDRAW
jgi:hypothetical protein